MSEATTDRWPSVHAGPSTTIALFAYGGILPQTMACVVRDLAWAGIASGYHHAHNAISSALQTPGATVRIGGPPPMWPVAFHLPPQDALIDRSRALCAKQFLAGEGEVLLMLDHDIEWNGHTDEYEGDLLHLARKCAETRGIVGALVCKKTRGQGPAVLWKTEGEWDLGVDAMIEVNAIGAAMTAYHRDVLEAAVARMGDETAAAYPGHRECAPGFTPIFIPEVLPHPIDPATPLHLSEDWALSVRAAALGFKSYAATKPITRHWGWYGYEVIRDGEHRALPKISVLHATRGRPDLAVEAMERWLGRASGQVEIEYIFSVDDDDPACVDFAPHRGAVVRGSSRGNVDAYNRAAYASTGAILVQAHDDVLPPPHWDLELCRRMRPSSGQVLLVSDGLAAEVNAKPGLATIMICTRAWARSMGGLFYPGYVSLFCDDDASEKAAADHAVVEARDLEFRHMWGGPKGDETYARSYSQANAEAGRELLKRRREAGFPDTPELWMGA